MTTQTISHSISTAAAGGMATTVSPETRDLMQLGQKNGWEFAVLGQAPLPENPIRFREWLIVPAHQDTSPIPERTMARIQTIFDAGMRPQGFVVVHEAPLLLSAGGETQAEELHISTIPPEIRSLVRLASAALGVLAMGILVATGVVIAAIAIFTLAAVLLVPLALVAGFAGLDPILIAVTEDGYWVEIDRWWQEG